MKQTVGVAKTNAKRPEKKQAKVFQKLENDQTERQENINENKKKNECRVDAVGSVGSRKYMKMMSILTAVAIGCYSP